jgi:2-dehydropantoate 2-reductase
MSRSIAVLGAGAIGSSVGADLTEAGEDVVLIDPWPAHVEAMRSGGLRVVMPDLDLETLVRALHIGELASERPMFDIVLLAAKSYDTTWMCHLIAPYLADDGLLVGLQNGMNEEMITPIVGRERTVACVVELSAEIWEPGLVQRDTTRSGTWFAVGELDGAITDRVEEVAALLRNSARVDVTDNIFGAKWSKLVVNCMTMGPYSLLGLKNWEASALPGMTEISVRIGRESATVGQALGYRLEPIFGMTAEQFSGEGDEMLVNAIRVLHGHIGKDATTATVQDQKKGRRTELDHITGTVVRKGREAGVPTPANDAVIELAGEITRGERKMEPANLEALKAILS